MIPHNRLTFGHKEEHAVREVVRTGYWAGGEQVTRLESELCELTGRKNAVAVSSGLSALRLALMALGVSRNDRVLVPAYSCVAIPNAVLSCNAIPVPVDVGMNNWNIEIKHSKLPKNHRIKAAIAVNTFGLGADFSQFRKLNIPVIEDCAHALGKTGEKLIFGRQGKVSIGSFYATKLIGGGEGGAFFSDSRKLAEFVRDYRDYTDKVPSGMRLNEKMSDIHAALTLSQCKRIDQLINRREEIANYYHRHFSALRENLPKLVLPQTGKRIWYRYSIHFQGSTAHKVISALQKEGVTADSPVSSWLNDNTIKRYPNAKFAYENLVSLPIYPTLTNREMEKVVTAMARILKKLKS